MTTSTTTEGRRLSGRLGPIGIVFMVVAAAAPLTVSAAICPWRWDWATAPVHPWDS